VDGKEGAVVMPAEKEMPNETRSHTLDKTGEYKLRCIIHDGMAAAAMIKVVK
jgi:plastocyanin